MRAALDLLRREPDFRRTFLSSLVSGGGDWFALIPLLALLHTLTGGGLAGGLVLASDTAVFALLSPYAGTVADRVDRRTLIVGCEAVSAALVLLLLLVRTPGTVWVSIVAVGGVAAAKAFMQPASSAAQPSLVGPDDLALANVLNGSAWGSMLAVGAALGGLAAALLGPDTCFVLDAVSFVVSALLVSRCRTPFQRPRESRDHAGFRADVAEAVRYARSQPRVLALLFAKPGVGLANGALVLFPLLSDGVFHAGALGLGLLYAARGLGAFTGPLLLGRGDRPLGLLPASIGGCGLLYVAVGVAPAFWVVLLLVTAAHVGGGANWTVSSYGLQRIVPDAVLGRISSADYMLVTLVIAVSQAASGVLSETVPTRLLTSAFGAAAVVYALGWLLATRSLRRDPALVPAGG